MNRRIKLWKQVPKTSTKNQKAKHKETDKSHNYRTLKHISKQRSYACTLKARKSTSTCYSRLENSLMEINGNWKHEDGSGPLVSLVISLVSSSELTNPTRSLWPSTYKQYFSSLDIQSRTQARRLLNELKEVAVGSICFGMYRVVVVLLNLPVRQGPAGRLLPANQGC